ncbi:helix-turn-helix domain-containing protein [Gemmatimonas groenlandica]|uniref:Helix-turn-helix transcriptional regulator n=1 Tax=Gemmatimonas groenlandica TaxID=2732249 RepID=A0A6M4ISX6_9BACT|nr:AraC family transcriptional regulator [Gemmatimonas groenlandica]QJR35351.1 helix-turn-helix transcriptional regulator [Gemmatimonas groenlandica]
MASPAPFRYAERLPHATLAPWIACYWEFTARDGAPSVHFVPPDGCTSLLVPTGGPHAGTLLYTGPWLEPLTVPVWPGARFVGVRLRPGGAAGVLQLPASTLLNATAPAVQIGGARGRALQQALSSCVMGSSNMDDTARALDAFWMHESHAFAAPDPLVNAAVNLLVESNGECTIADAARLVGCSERTLLRRFRAATALTPKQFARIRRLLAAAWHAVDGEERWGRIAAAAGYADQPHLNHDVKALTGLRPEELSERIGFTEHDQVNRTLSG